MFDRNVIEPFSKGANNVKALGNYLHDGQDLASDTNPQIVILTPENRLHPGVEKYDAEIFHIKYMFRSLGILAQPQVIKYLTVQGAPLEVQATFLTTSRGKALFQYDPALEYCERGPQKAGYRLYFEE